MYYLDIAEFGLGFRYGTEFFFNVWCFVVLTGVGSLPSFCRRVLFFFGLVWFGLVWFFLPLRASGVAECRARMTQFDWRFRRLSLMMPAMLGMAGVASIPERCVAPSVAASLLSSPCSLRLSFWCCCCCCCCCC